MCKIIILYIATLVLLFDVVSLAKVDVQAPSKAQIAFNSDRDGNMEIYVMEVDGNKPRRLTNSPGEDSNQTWFSDGKKIAFCSFRDGNYEIYVMDADGNNQNNLTNNRAFDLCPDWFDPAYAKAVSAFGKLESTWGTIKVR